MLAQYFQDLGKQNSDYINRLKHPNNKIYNKKVYSDWQQNSSQETIQVQQMEHKIQNHIKKQKIKEFIAKILSNRRQKDRLNSHKQIYYEVKMFKVFKIWKKVTAIATRLKIQAQLVRQKRQFIFLKNVFQEWDNLIRKPKQQNYQIKKKWFQTLKIICTTELSIRLRRIQLQTFLLKRSEKQFIYHARQQQFVSEKKMQKAINFWQKQTKFKTFALFKKLVCRDIDLRLRYQQYKLAYLFRSKSLLSRGFDVFKSK